MGVISEVKSVMSVISEVKVKRCPIAYILAIKDAINVMHGKWKLHIIGSLIFGKKRFKELERDIPNITPRMLSKELRDLEGNGIVKRTVYDTIPVKVEYELTESGRSFEQVMDVMVKWGLEHRENVIGKQE
ncbi:winged helix-turn-helix transcriptional regulator [Maribellus maritimus]|uniref:winged helix-turn-helix transcriptional regulator n=1 Tax=Maribellus maritimus TaxID=2870838 RepID=UPI001EEA6078|nr:helix-turn-helix domain-containing protein [Maribellus maritimus]